MDKNKLLPGARQTNNGGAIVLAKDSIIPRTRRSIVRRSALIKKPVEETPSTKSSKKRLIDINKLVQNNLFTSRKRYKDRFRNIQKDRKEERESLLEKRQVNPKTSKVSRPEMPKTGLLDGVKNYVSNVLMGILFTNIQKVMPVVMSVYKGLRPLIGFLGDMSGKILNGLITFINEGYKAYDQTRKWIGQKFGEKGTEKFDELVKKFDQFLTTAVTIGVIYSKLKFKRKPKPELPQPVLPKPLSSGSVSRSNASYSRFVQGKANIGDRARLLRRGQIGPTGMVTRGGFNAQGQLRGQSFRKAPSGAPTTGYRPPAAMSGWMRNTGKILRALGLYFLFTEIEKDVAKGDYKAVTVKLSAYGLGWLTTSFLAAAGLAATATGVGSVPGVAVVAGSMAAGAGVDYGVRKMFGYAQGGQITRNGKPVGGPVRRGLANIPSNTSGTRFVGAQKSNPGQDIGGRKNLEKIFPNPAEKDKPNAMKVLERASSSFKNVSSINGIAGAIMGIPIDAIMGQKTNTMVIREIGEGFGSYIETEVNKQLNSIMGFAAGGQIPRTNPSDVKSKNIGKRIGANISMAFASALTFRVNEILNELRMQSGKKGATTPPGGGGAGPGGGGGAGPGGAPLYGGPGIEGLASFIAKAESGGRYDAYAGDNGRGNPDIIKMTLNELKNKYGDYNTAVGAYQFMPGTAIGLAKKLGLDPKKTIFSADIQKKLHIKHLRDLGYDKYVSGKMSRNDFGTAIAQQYRALPDPRTGKTYADQYARGNAATVTLIKFNEALDNSKKKAVEMVPKVTGGILPSQIPLTSGQGWRWGRMHKGIDLDGGDKSPISSTQDAYVVWAGDKGDGYGNSVILKYANGAETRFAHFSSINVKTGQKIKAGQLLGKQGKTGSSTESHLHFEFYPNGGAMTYQGYGDAFSVKDTYFRYGGNVQPILPDKPLDAVKPPKLPEVGSGLNKGVYYDSKQNKFFKKGSGILGLPQEINPNIGTNIQFRSLPNFLGRGKKEGEIKQGPDKKMYKWDGKYWREVAISSNANASLPSQSPISAQIAFNPLPLDSSAIKQTPSYDQSTKEVIIMRQTTIVREPVLA